MNIYRSLESGQYGETPINSAPIPGTSYADTDITLGTRYYYRTQAVRYDSLKSYFAGEPTIVAGAPLTPTGLVAESGNDGFIPLSWNPNTEPDLDHYVVYREDSAGVFQYLATSIENQYVDLDVINGLEYTYSVSAVDDDGFESNLSDSSSAIPMGFTDSLLIILKFNGGGFLLEWEDDSLEAYYHQLFEDIEESPDYYTIVNNDTFPSLMELSPYRTIWIIDDNHNLAPPSPVFREARDQILSTYLSLGGNVVYSGRRVFNGSFGEYYSLTPILLGSAILREYFMIDSILATCWPSSAPPGDFIEAASVVPDYPSLDVDSAKVEMLLPIAYLEVDGMVPANGGEIIYTYESSLPDSSPLQGMATGIRYNNMTAMITFPLYAMEPYDSVLTLADNILDYVRLPHVGIDDITTEYYIPQAFSLRQNYPNPFNARTMIEFEVPHRSKVVLSIFNVLGRRVAELANKTFNPGVYRFSFDGADLSSGIYFINLSAGDFRTTRKMLLIK